MFHGYRPQIDDDDVFMEKLMAQMDAEDTKQQLPRIVPLYRRVLPWVAGVAAAVVAAVLIIEEPAKPSVASYNKPRLPEYYHSVPLHQDLSSYEDIVSEIERSGRQLENAIAQL